MAKQQQKLITAKHVSRVDQNGDPQIKQFTVQAWNNIPMRHYSSREDGIVKQDKSGWVITAEVKKAPEPLKKADITPTVQAAPVVTAPQQPRPTPRPPQAEALEKV